MYRPQRCGLFTSMLLLRRVRQLHAMTASTVSIDSLTFARPDDWHLHVRDGAMLAAVLPDTARQFGRAIIMPNLKPPVTTTAMAQAYRERIVAAIPAGVKFEPLMTLYLTDNTPPDEIRRAPIAACRFPA
jgi:dihydroorotase